MISLRRLLAASLFFVVSLNYSERLLAMILKEDCAICLNSLSFPSEAGVPEGIELRKDLENEITLPCSHKFHTTCLLDAVEHRSVLCPICHDARAGFSAYNFCKSVTAGKKVQLMDKYAQDLLKELSNGGNGKHFSVRIVRDIVNTVGEYFKGEGEEKFFNFMNTKTGETKCSAIDLAKQYNDPNIDEDNIETILLTAAEKYLSGPYYAQVAKQEEIKCLLCGHSLSQEGAPCHLQLRTDILIPKKLVFNCSDPFEINGNQPNKHECHFSCVVNKITDKQGNFKTASSCPHCENKLATADAYNRMIPYFKNQNCTLLGISIPFTKRSPIYTVYPAKFLQAARENNVVLVKNFIIEAQNANNKKQLPDDQLFEFIMAQGLGGKTALDFADKNGNPELVTYLLNIRNSENYTLWRAAICQENAEWLQVIMNAIKEWFNPQQFIELLEQEYDCIPSVFVILNRPKALQIILKTIKTGAFSKNPELFFNLLGAAVSCNKFEALKMILEAIDECLLSENPTQFIELLNRRRKNGKTVWMSAESEEVIEILQDAEKKAKTVLEVLGQ